MFTMMFYKLLSSELYIGLYITSPSFERVKFNVFLRVFIKNYIVSYNVYYSYFVCSACVS